MRRRCSTPPPNSAVSHARFLALGGVRTYPPHRAPGLVPSGPCSVDRRVERAMFFFRFLVVRVEALLKLVDGREGCEIGWYLAIVWVSGCQLFSVTSAGYVRAPRWRVRLQHPGTCETPERTNYANLNRIRHLARMRSSRGT